MCIITVLSNNRREITLSKMLRQNCFSNILSIQNSDASFSLILIKAAPSIHTSEQQKYINKINNNPKTTILLSGHSGKQKYMSTQICAHIPTRINIINPSNGKNSLHPFLIQKGQLQMMKCEAEFDRWNEYDARCVESTFFIKHSNIDFKGIEYAKN